ncbi:hypothetical protein LPJ61_003271, partial [Coemansia biformis]
MSMMGPPLSHSYTYQPVAREPQPSDAARAPEAGADDTDTPGEQAAPSRQKKPSRPPRNHNKFKRFRNAFIYYVNDQRQVDKVDEDVRRLKNREFLQLMSAQWKSLPLAKRQPYMRLAEEDKRRFNEDVMRFGKYESRQRKCLKGQSPEKS